MPPRSIFNPPIRFSLTEERLQAEFTELKVFPRKQLTIYGKSTWHCGRFTDKRYGHNTSNNIEILNNWIVEERKLSVVDVLHALWSKVMDLRFRYLQEENCLDSEAITEYSAKMLEVSMNFSNHRTIRYADPLHTSVLSISRKRYLVDFEVRACTCDNFQYGDIPCGHADAVIQTYRSPDGAQARRSARDFVAYNLALTAFRVTYDFPVEIATLAPHENEPCRTPLFKKARGRSQTARLTAGGQERYLRLTMGRWRVSLIVYSVVPAVERKGIMYFVAQLSLAVCSLRDQC